MVQRRPQWMPILSSDDAFDTLAADTAVFFNIPSIADTSLGGITQRQYTTRRVVFNFLLENQTVDIIVGIGIIYRQDTIGATQPPRPVLEPAADWQYHEYVTNGSTADFPTMISRDISISRRTRALDLDLVFAVENRTAQTVAFHLGGRALVLRL